MAAILAALGTAGSIADVRCGAPAPTSREPAVLALEPSIQMIGHRPPEASTAVRAVAEALPLRDGAVDAVMAVLTVHHWTEWRAGSPTPDRPTPGRPRVRHPPAPEFWFVREYVPEIPRWNSADPRPPTSPTTRRRQRHTPLLPWDFTDGVSRLLATPGRLPRPARPPRPLSTRPNRPRRRRARHPPALGPRQRPMARTPPRPARPRPVGRRLPPHRGARRKRVIFGRFGDARSRNRRRIVPRMGSAYLSCGQLSSPGGSTLAVPG